MARISASRRSGNKAKRDHRVPLSNIRPKTINTFLDAMPLPDAQKSILKSASTNVWKTAANNTWDGKKFATGLSPNEPVPHYDLRSAAMHILQHGVEKLSGTKAKIANKLEGRRNKNAEELPVDDEVAAPTNYKPLEYNPLDVFSDRRKLK